MGETGADEAHHVVQCSLTHPEDSDSNYAAAYAAAAHNYAQPACGGNPTWTQNMQQGTQRQPAAW